MKALAIRRYKAPMEMMELPRPEPGPGDLLVRVRAASVNPIANASMLVATDNITMVPPREGSLVWLCPSASSPERIMRTPTKPNRPKAIQ